MTILASSRMHKADQYTLKHCVVLRHLAEDQWVIHTQIFQADGSYSFQHGHYFFSYNEALKAYKQRKEQFEFAYQSSLA